MSLQVTASQLSRRSLLRYLFISGGAAAAGPLLNACSSSPSLELNDSPSGGGDATTPVPSGGELSIPSGSLAGIGELGPADLDGVRVPKGFVVRNVARAGSTPAVGSPYLWHTFPDGGACYPRENGGWIYTSNSELPGGLGGCGALVFDPDGTVVDAYSILSNTSGNCAGGSTPWNTWVSCEENGDAGQCWETDPYGAVGAVAKPALGFFNHEAFAVDIRHRVVYLTEDNGNGRFYRWVANESDYSSSDNRLALESGTLQVMEIEGFEAGGYADDPADLHELRRVSWSEVVDPDQGQEAVRAGLAAAGETVPGTRIAGGEGLWFAEIPAGMSTVPPGGTVPTRGLVFFTSKGDNRVYALDVENQLIELIFDNAQIEPGFNDVDNLTVSPAGDILVAEDLTESRAIRIMVVIPNQPAKVLVEVEHPGSEICGPAFSPDGSRLYFSSQRGPIVPGGQALFGFVAGAPGSGTGATYEVLIPEEFRS